jgi:sulfide:quinone oxidoreductase
MPRIVVLGGGVGGTLVANLLAKKLRKRAEITLVSATPRHVYQPGWLYVPFGWQEPRSLSRSLRSLLNRMVALEIAEVQGLDLEGRKVHLPERDLEYDYLVIATGARIVPEEIPGFVEGAHHFYTEEGALKLQKALKSFRGGKVVVGVGGLPHKCPPAPLEFTFLLEEYLSREGLRERTEITYTYPINRVFSIESVAQIAEPLLQERRVRIETFFNVESVDPERRVVTSLEGTELPYDLLVMVPPHRGARFLEGLPIADAQGWVQTDRSTLQVKGYPGVYALGDATDLPISKAGSTAHFEAPVIAERIAAEIEGREPDPRRSHYDGKVNCFLEVGHERATFLAFDYQHPPKPPAPSWIYHYEKLAFNKAYWYLVPTGVV